MHFVEYHKLEVSGDVGPAVQHGAKDFRSHHQAGSGRVDLKVTGQQAYLPEHLVEIIVLLVRQSLDWRCVYRSVMSEIKLL